MFYYDNRRSQPEFLLLFLVLAGFRELKPVWRRTTFTIIWSIRECTLEKISRAISRDIPLFSTFRAGSCRSPRVTGNRGNYISSLSFPKYPAGFTLVLHTGLTVILTRMCKCMHSHIHHWLYYGCYYDESHFLSLYSEFFHFLKLICP